MTHGPWKWVLYPAKDLTSPMGEITEAHSRKVSWRIWDADASFELDARHELAQFVDELVVDLHVLYDSDTLFVGRIGPSSDDGSEDQHRCTFTAVDYGELLRRRNLTYPQAPWTFTGIAQGSIVRQLIAWTEGTSGGDLGLTYTTATVPDTATSRTITFELNKWVAEAIDDLAAMENGFDWWIDGALVVHIASPQRGAARDLVLEYGATASGFKRAFDPAIYGNAAVVSGKEGTGPRYATAADIATRPEGRLDLLESFPDVASGTALQSRANQLIAETSTMRPAYTFRMVRGKWRPYDLWAGDVTWGIVDSGRLDVRATQRVQQIDVTLDEDGAEDVDITLGSLPPNLARRVRTMARRIARVERLGSV